MRNRLFSDNARQNDEPSAQLMARSLLNHAKEVYRYAVTYCAPTDDNDYLDAESRASFVRNLKRMVSEMSSLMRLASEKGVSRLCNTEQIEAYMDAATEAVSNPTRQTENQLLMN